MKNSSISLVKTGGKQSFKRYCDFFTEFDVDVYIICDLDILIDGFNKIDPDNKNQEVHDQLLQMVDEYIFENCHENELSDSDYAKQMERGDRKCLIPRIKKARKENDHEIAEDLLEQYFSFENKNPRLEVLKDPPTDNIRDAKECLINNLHNQNVFVLSKGQIENYYPEDIEGKDKPSKAQDFCRKYSNTDQLCDAFCIEYSTKNERVRELQGNEFYELFDRVFSS